MNDDLREMAEGYLNGTLSEAEVSRLESLLQGDAKSKQDFAAHLVLHGQLGLVADEFRGTERSDLSLETTSLAGVKKVVTVASAQRSVWRMTVVSAVAASLLIAVFWFSSANFNAGNAKESAYDLAPIPIRTIGYDAGGSNQAIPVIAGSNASSARSTDMRTDRGTTVNVSRDSCFGFASETCGLLYRGEVLVSSLDSKSEYAIEIQNVRILGHNARFQLQRNDDSLARIEALEGQVEIQTRAPGPRLYWSLDNNDDRDRQKLRTLPLLLGDDVERVPGLIGPGALGFTQRSGAYATMVGGTEPQVGGGLFSMSGGMSIETVIMSTWDGADDNNAVIFRKEDGPNRILLSFQNNQKTENEFAMPKVPSGPVLSFGIYLRKLGYSELDMPLDGKDGRPTVAQLTDGKPHMITASYDSFSGIKAIAIDGQVRFTHQFPFGHCIQSGGPKAAMIGGWRKRETFSGVIDELAIYDYALSDEELESHYELFRQGKHWISKLLDDQAIWKTIHTISPGNHHDLQISKIKKTFE